ncbi:MAG: nuclear transport factor 2 family protein, partial [Alphaproteobacteria bacterium]|nr:nuclear transport factor 2 family protein [Alphaproteobacteria bacterium]
MAADRNLAYGHSIQRVSSTDKNGKPIGLTVRLTRAYREINGRWLIEHEHVSVPVDLDTDVPDLASKPFPQTRATHPRLFSKGVVSLATSRRSARRSRGRSVSCSGRWHGRGRPQAT